MGFCGLGYCPYDPEDFPDSVYHPEDFDCSDCPEWVEEGLL